MEYHDLVLKRRMVRNFSDRPVDPEIIERIVGLTRHAPSAGFTQGQSFIIVSRQDLRESIAKLCGETEYTGGGFDPFISAAPILLVPCTSEAAYHRRYQETDKLDEMVWKSIGRFPFGSWTSDVL